MIPIDFEGEQLPSKEHVYLSKNAGAMGNDDLAGDIKSATHASIAKALSWTIQSREEAQVKWEADNEDLMMKH